MSGDVQPRKRKDKKKKRDDEASHGVHITKMGSDDVHLHVHEEHGTGGHWCAKIIFFSLMTILMGLVCLIILENRGISDVDTPLSESRFSNYFDGWVDEHRDEHDDKHGSLDHEDHDDEHDDDDDEDHDEPFEEEEDHSEGDEDVEENENVTPEEEDDEEGDNVTQENNTGEEEDEDGDDDDNATVEEGEDEDEDDDNATAENDNVTAETEADDDNATDEATIEENDDDDDNDDANNTNEEDDNITRETSNPASNNNNDNDDDNDDGDDPFDEEDDDGTFESIEKVVDNDAAELELLKEKARQQAAAEAKNNPASVENDNDDEGEKTPSWASSMAVKIGVGLALALVARLVLIRKNPISNDEAAPEHLMKRRLTIAMEDEVIPEGVEEVLEPLPEDDYSEEEIEIEEEIEYIEEDEEILAEENQVDAGDNHYVPASFELLNAMYRPKDFIEETEQKTASKPIQPSHLETYLYPSQNSTTLNKTNNDSLNKSSQIETPTIKETVSYTQNERTDKTPARFEAPPPPSPLMETQIDVAPKYMPAKEDTANPESSRGTTREVTHDIDYETQDNSKTNVNKEVTYDMDYQQDNEDIDYDEDDIYDDEEGQDNDSEDLDDEDLLDDDEDAEDAEEGEDASDVDDTELMKRLEAKYGKLPANEYESDEDPDDPSWTQIKPKTGGGPQSTEDDDLDLFEQKLRKANDEMMREFNYH